MNSSSISSSSSFKLNRRFSMRKINAEFKEIFNLVDRDGEGTITAEEIGSLIETLGIHASPKEVELLVAEIDKDKSGAIDFHGTSFI